MSIPSRQIGWSNEANLLWQISKTLERAIDILTCCPATTTTTTTVIVTTTTTTTIGLTTTTTTTAECTLWMLYNTDGWLITWTYTECGNGEQTVEQNLEDPPIFVCSVSQPTTDGELSEAVNTQEACSETPTTTTTTTTEEQGN